MKITDINWEWNFRRGDCHWMPINVHINAIINIVILHTYIYTYVCTYLSAGHCLYYMLTLPLCLAYVPNNCSEVKNCALKVAYQWNASIIRIQSAQLNCEAPWSRPRSSLAGISKFYHFKWTQSYLYMHIYINTKSVKLYKWIINT